MLKVSSSKGKKLTDKESFVIEYKGKQEPMSAWRFHSGHGTEDKMNNSFETLKKVEPTLDFEYRIG